MKIVWEADTWWFEEMGFAGEWWWGFQGTRWPISFNLRYPDKAAHAFGAFLLAHFLARVFSPISPAWVAGAAFLLLWVGLEVRYMRHNGVLSMGSWKDTFADALGAAAFYVARR